MAALEYNQFTLLAVVIPAAVSFGAKSLALAKVY